MSDPGWKAEALCIGRSELFLGTGSNKEDSAEARAICAECPVQDPCLEEGLSHHCDGDVWGGQTTQQRVILRAQRNKERLVPGPCLFPGTGRCGTTNGYTLKCRGPECRARQAERSRDYRERVQQMKDAA